MSFNPDPNKQAQEVLFSRKIQKSSQPSLIFNNNIVTQSLTQKHLGMFLDTKLDFQEHLKSIFSKVNKAIGLLRKLHHILPRSPLLTIYKSFIRPHLDYGDIIYYQAYNASFHQKLDSIQYNAALAIRGTIRATSTEKLYNELGLETLEKKRWYGKLCCFLKIFRYKCPKYLFNTIPTSRSIHNTRNTNNILLIKVKHNFFQNSFCGNRMEQTGPKFSQFIKLECLQENTFDFIRPSGSTVFNCHNLKGVNIENQLFSFFTVLIFQMKNQLS